MTQILCDIQNHKTNSRNRIKTKNVPIAASKISKKSAVNNNYIDNINKSSLPFALSIEQSECIFQNECDTSIDIFKELELEKMDSVFDVQNLSYRDISSCEEDYEMFNDVFMTKQNLLSYIHVCIYNDQLSEAHSFLLEFVDKFSNVFTSANIASCCELLVKGWARKGNTENVDALKDYIKNNLKMHLTTQIYEYYLLAFAKQIKEPSIEEVQNVISEMKNNNLNPEYLFYKSNLNTSEIKIIKSFLQKHKVNLNFKQLFYPKTYNNRLVDEIVSQKPKPYNPFEGLDLSDMDKLVEQQFNMEIASIVKVPPIDAKFYDLDTSPEKNCLVLIKELESKWKLFLTSGFENYLNSIKTKKLNGIPFLHYMTVVEPEFYIDAMLEEIRKCASFSEHYSPFATHLFENLGRKVMYQYLLRSNLNDETLDDFKKCYNKYVEYTLNPSLMQKYNPREYWQYLSESGYHYYFDDSKFWSRNILREVGKDLYEIISNEARFDSFGVNMEDELSTVQPVISFIYKHHDTVKTKKEVRINPMLIKLYEDARSDIHFESERLPMLSPPMPWINSNSGGNLLIRNFLVRLPIYYPKHQFKNHPIQQLYPTFDSLNALSLCPWRINEKVCFSLLALFGKFILFSLRSLTWLYMFSKIKEI